jgi:hypothetical protein
MKKIYILIITIHFVFVSENICQTYLFNGNKSGFSAMVGVFSVRSYTRQNAAFFGAEATISGYLSFGWVHFIFSPFARFLIKFRLFVVASSYDAI